jgi:hypothetical protein
MKSNKLNWIFIVLIFAMMVLNVIEAKAQTGYKNGLALGVGPYAAEGLGTNLYFELRYNHFLSSGKYFFEGGIGIGSIESKLLKSISNSQIFEDNNLTIYQFLFGYDHKYNSGIPYLVGGFAGLDQGGQSRFAFVLGIGKRFSLWGPSKFGLRYDIRTHIFKQELNNNASFTSLNIAFTIGVEYLF